VGLARKRVPNVGIVLYREDDAMANNFYSFVVQGAVKEALERDYNVLFSYVSAAYGGVEDLPKIVREKNAEGVLFVRRVDPSMIKDVAALSVSVVLVDTFPRVEEVNALNIDNVRGGRLAGEHLFALGHEHVAMLLPRDPAPSIADRLDGFRGSFERSFSRAANVIQADGLTHEAAYEAVASLLSRKRPVTGIFCANDEMASGALRAARDAGLDVPKDLSVVGFDDISLASFTAPPLTTIGVVKEEMGRRAMARLIELVKGEERAVRVDVAPVRLVVRGSTARHRKRA
jgi:DNA-binding LacI/PurR family transcriptional regulator